MQPSTAMLDEQWFNHYAQVEMRGSVIDCSHHRQHKINGIVTWHVDLPWNTSYVSSRSPPRLCTLRLPPLHQQTSVTGIVTGFTAFNLSLTALMMDARSTSNESGIGSGTSPTRSHSQDRSPVVPMAWAGSAHLMETTLVTILDYIAG